MLGDPKYLQLQSAQRQLFSTGGETPREKITQTAGRTASTLPMTGHHGREGFLRPKSEGSGSSTRST